MTSAATAGGSAAEGTTAGLATTGKIFHLEFHSLPKRGLFRNALQCTLVLSHVKIIAC